MRSRILLSFVAYLAAAIWLTWPLAANCAAYLPCTNPYCGADTLYSVWVLSYGSHALGSASDGLLGGNVFHPEPHAVLYGPAGFGALPYFAPIFLLSGNPVLAMNLAMLLCIALTATGLHVLAWRLTGEQLAGLVAAAVFLTNRWVLWGFVASAPHLAALQYFPFIMLLAARQRAGVAWAVGLLALVVLQCSTELVYVALAVLVPLAVLAIVRLARPETRTQGLRLAGIVAAVPLILAPLYLAYASVRSANPQLLEQTTWPSELPTDVGALFWTHYSPLATSSAVLLLIVLGAGVALWRRRGSDGARRLGWRHGALWTGVGIVISLAPSLHWGPVAIATPQDVIEWLTPLYEVIRAPTRLGVAALMGICLLAGVAYAELHSALVERAGRSVPRGVLVCCLTVVVLAAIYSTPVRGGRPIPATYPLQLAPALPAAFVVPLYADDGPLLLLPVLTLRGKPDILMNARAMFQSTYHWRPMLNGYSSYWPKDYLGNLELAERLPDRDALAELVRRTGVALIWVDLAKLPENQVARWESLATTSENPDLRLIARAGSNLLVAVEPRQAQPAPATGAGIRAGAS